MKYRIVRRRQISEYPYIVQRKYFELIWIQCTQFLYKTEDAAANDIIDIIHKRGAYRGRYIVREINSEDILADKLRK